MSQPVQTPNVPEISRAMILAAGLGTRFKPWTDRHPKALALVNSKSLLQRNVEYLQRYGIRELVVNVHHFAGQIADAIAAHNGWGSAITISDETQEVLETGGGLKKAGSLLRGGGPFLLMNVDILTDLDLSLLIRDHLEHQPLVTLAVTGRETSRYFLFDERQELCGWRNTKTGEEKIARPGHSVKAADGIGPRESGPGGTASGGAVPAGSGADAAGSGGKGPGAASPDEPGFLAPKAFSGIQVVEPDIFPLMRMEGKFSLVDVYLDLAREHTIRGFDHSDSRLIDVGRPESVERAERLFP